MIILDAGAIIAYLNPADQHHAATRDTLAGHPRTPFMASALNLTEAMVRPVLAGIADQVLRKLFEQLDLTMVPVLGTDVLRLAEIRASTRLKLPDCCVLLAAERTGAGAIVTFDDRLRDAARKHGLIVLPA